MVPGLCQVLWGRLVGIDTYHIPIPRNTFKTNEESSQVDKRFEISSQDLVICDEFGYVSFDKEGAELLFNHLSLRIGRKSTIITTNLGFDRWSEIFGDPILTAALVGRITHKAYLVNMKLPFVFNLKGVLLD